MKREHKPLEMIHAEWHDVKKEDKETRVKWLIKHQKMMLPYDINWEKLIECNRTGKWPIIAKPKPIKLPSFLDEKSKDLKVFWIEFPKTLSIISFFSNFVIEVSLIVKVDWHAVSLLNNSVFFEI